MWHTTNCFIQYLYFISNLIWLHSGILIKRLYQICLNNPIFLKQVVYAASWAYFMCHHELWPISMGHPFSFRNSFEGKTRKCHPHLWSCFPVWWRHQTDTYSALLAFYAGNSPVTGESPHKGRWRGALMFSLICAWRNGWVNNREAGDMRRHQAHYDVIVMRILHWMHCKVMTN